MASHSKNRISDGCITLLSFGRVLVGSSTLLAPQVALPLFGIGITPGTNVLMRLFGVRDLAVGTFLWKSRSSLSRAMATGDALKIREARQDVQNMLWMGLLCDSVDVISFAIAILVEGLQEKAVGYFGVGAVVFTALGTVAIRGSAFKQCN